MTIFHCSYTSVFLHSLPRTDGTHGGKVLGDGVGVSDLYYCNAHSLCGGQKGLKTEGFFNLLGVARVLALYKHISQSYVVLRVNRAKCI